jgi:uncharacterized cupredoxin-like copper-binding protein
VSRRHVGVVALAVTVVAGAAPARAAAPAPTRLLVQATEFKLSLSRARLAAGPAIVQLADNGEDPHDLVLVRVDARGHAAGAARAVPLAQPGTVSEWKGRLTRGRWKLFCSLDGHERRGMRALVRVR